MSTTITLANPITIPSVHTCDGCEASEVGILGVNVRLDTSEILIDVSLGATVEGSWVSSGGRAGKGMVHIRNKPAHIVGGDQVAASDKFDEFVSDNQVVYDAFMSALCAWMVAEGLYEEAQ